jgi:isopentenyl-diphosphate Delta-isomerase
MDDKEMVILVDENDRQLGTMEKMEAHRKGILHRAFSVFIFNPAGEMLLQRRAADKYHSPGLLTNTCCSHPRPGESTADAASRRLIEEMGIKADLRHKTSFIYKTRFDNALTEHEFDHVFFGVTNKSPVINRHEVQEYCWMKIENIKEEIKRNPEQFTSWFRIAMEKLFF